MFRCGNIFLRDVPRFYSFDKDYWLRVGVVTGDMYAFCSQVYLTGSFFCAAILLVKCRETGSVIVGRGDHCVLFSKPETVMSRGGSDNWSVWHNKQAFSYHSGQQSMGIDYFV